MDTMALKPCSKCGEGKARCPECRRKANREAMRRYRAANPEAARERQRRWREANPGYSQVAMQRWRAANPEAAQEADRRRRAANPEAAREADRRRYTANLEVRREASRRRYAANPDPAREDSRRRAAANRTAVLDHYGRECACCGSVAKLTIDHVNGDGKAHRAQIGVRAGAEFYSWLIKNNFPSDPPLQVLCTPCNQSKSNSARCRIDHIHAAVPLVIAEDGRTVQALPVPRNAITTTEGKFTDESY